MFKSRQSPLPEGSFLARYLDREGAYTDCFRVDVPGGPDLPAYIETFFDSWVFRLERRVLTLAGKGPATRKTVEALAHQDAQRFAAWIVRERDDSQILMEVPRTPIRTWLRVLPSDEQPGHVRLYFGSALVPPHRTDGAPARLGPLFRWTTGLHKLYSHILLDAAARDWKRSAVTPQTT